MWNPTSMSKGADKRMCWRKRKQLLGLLLK